MITNDYYHSLQSDYEVAASSKPIINLELIFSHEVASPVYTKQNIARKASGVGENESVNLILIDRKTREIVTSGPIASSQVKIVLLRGDCGEILTTPEFKSNIVVDWGNKKNLLLGDVYVNLENGRGTVGEIRIKHDRNPLKNVRFRLGAMLVGCSDGYEVKEAITNPFDVKDARNGRKNLRALKLEDEVWCLKNIAKNGKIHERLAWNNIFTVKKFLDLHSSNPLALQEMYGTKGKKWNETINHAKTCLLENMSNACRRIGSTSQQLNTNPSSASDDDNCYRPQPCDHDYIFSNMIVDDNFSIKEYEGSGTETILVHEAILVQNGGEWAKKRWMKLRTFWFLTPSFMKKLGSCVGATLVTSVKMVR